MPCVAAMLLAGCAQPKVAAPPPPRKIDLVGPLPTRPTEPAVRPADSAASNGVIVNNLGMRMVLVPAGVFQMGSPMNEPGRQDDEYRHEVQLHQRIYVAATEVTQAQWHKIMQTKPWLKQANAADDREAPATHVSYDDALSFCQLLSKLENQTYRLPTEAEWERACRGGMDGPFAGDNGNGIMDMAWHDANVPMERAQPVAQKRPNAWGLYDMHGNVAEWCLDWYGHYPRSSVVNPTGPPKGDFRVVRGGAWDSAARFCRSAYRTGLDPASKLATVGFRVVLVK